MGRRIECTCDMCGTTVNDELPEVNIFNYGSTRWDCPIPEIYLCEACLEEHLLRKCGIDMDKIASEFDKNKPRDPFESVEGKLDTLISR